MKRSLKVIRWIVTCILIFILALTILQKVTNNKISLGNVYIFQVVSESMLPKYHAGDVIIVKKENPNLLKIGDDITYLGEKNELKGLTITHRIINIRKDKEKYFFTTKGTANEFEDPEIIEDNVYGKVVYHTVLFSLIGRAMTNVVLYYLIFIVVGVSFAYEILNPLINKGYSDDEEDDE
jgi:signal peptidase I